MSVAYDYYWFEPYIYEQGWLTMNFGISLTTA